MAGIRIKLDLFIPKPVYDAIPDAKKQATREVIRGLKALAVKLNEGKINEEMSVKATWHICYHDENINQPCESEQEI